MHPLLNIAISAARAAGNTIIRASQRLDTIEVREKNPNDYVTEIDQRAEQQIIEIIRKAYPNHAVLGEESGLSTSDMPNKEEVTWIIDPIDGTSNFLHGFPHFAVSIAISIKGRVEHGVIYDPIRNDLFTASYGGGARCNDRRLRVSKHNYLKGSLIGTGFPYREVEKIDAYISEFKSLTQQCVHIRRAGAATLDLAYVAAGSLDGFWEHGLKPWDIAAGALMIKEAGGLVTDFEGGENFMESGHIVAGNPKILKAILKQFAQNKS